VAAKNYGPGVTDSEIKIGNTAPYSGPLSNARPCSAIDGRLFQDDQRTGWYQRKRCFCATAVVAQ
jgi:hypothetical protein